jgi:phage terminase small subunit
MALTAKRRKVVDEFMKCANQKEAMLAAGYSQSMSATRSADIFKDPAVMREIERRQNLATHRSDVTLDWVVERLKAVADANLGDALDIYSDGTASINFNKLTPQLKKALNKFTVSTKKDGRGGDVIVDNKVGFSDQLKALELLVRHLGLSKEKTAVELTGEVSLVERLHAGRSRAGLEDE